MSAVELCNDLSLRTFSRVLGDKTLARDQKYLDAFNAWSSGNTITGFIALFISSHILRYTLSWPLVMYQKHIRQRRLFNAAKGHVLRRLEAEKSDKRDSTQVDALQAAITLRLPRERQAQAIPCPLRSPSCSATTGVASLSNRRNLQAAAA